MGTSIGQAIDWLVANWAPAVAAVDAVAVVSDNEPTYDTPSIVAVGRTLPLDASGANGTQVLLTLGAQKSEEEYSIPCFIQAFRAGPAQKPSRDAAIALFDACHHVIAHRDFVNTQNDGRTLGGALLDGRIAYIENVRYSQSKNSGDAGGALRVTTITFDVHCKNQYVP